MRYSDCDIEEFKIRRALHEAQEGPVVDAAMRDLLNGKFDSEAVNEVLARRAGTIAEYVKVKDLYDATVRAARHAGTLK